MGRQDLHETQQGQMPNPVLGSRAPLQQHRPGLPGWGSSSGENILRVWLGSEQDMSHGAPWQQGEPSSTLACVNRGTVRRSRAGIILSSAQPLLNHI